MQEFDLEIEDKKGSENVAADHLSRLMEEEVRKPDGLSIQECFPDERLFMVVAQVVEGPWFANIANYLATGSFPKDVTPQGKRKILTDMKNYFWDDPYLLRRGADRMI